MYFYQKKSTATYLPNEQKVGSVDTEEANRRVRGHAKIWMFKPDYIIARNTAGEENNRQIQKENKIHDQKPSKR